MGLAVFVAAVVLLLLFAYIYISMSIVKITDEIDYELKKTNQQISQEKAAEYIDKLENMPLKFIFADQYNHNLYLSKLYEITGEYDKLAISAEKLSEEMGEEQPIARYYLGMAYYKNNEYDKAEKEFNKAISIENTHLELFLSRQEKKEARIYWAEHAEEGVFSFLVEHISFQERINIYKALADIYVHKENSEKVSENLKKAVEEKIFFMEYKDLKNRNGENDNERSVIINEFAKKIVIKHNDSDYINEMPDVDYGSDSDNDGLSDNLEDVLSTNKFRKDTDRDGFDDKKELINGYDPLKKSPEDEMEDVDYYNLYIKIIDL